MSVWESAVSGWGVGGCAGGMTQRMAAAMWLQTGVAAHTSSVYCSSHSRKRLGPVDI